MGPGATVGAGNYPAKYYFDVTANCATATQPDFVVYNTSLAGVGPVPARNTGMFTGAPTNAQTATIGGT